MSDSSQNRLASHPTIEIAGVPGKHKLNIGEEDEKTVLAFHLPDDALADEKPKAVENLRKDRESQQENHELYWGYYKVPAHVGAET